MSPDWEVKFSIKSAKSARFPNLPAYVLRFWESEFSFLRPKKSRGNQRLYVQRDVDTVLEIKRMLYDEGHTLAGVKRYWARRGRATVKKRSSRKELAQACQGRSPGDHQNDRFPFVLNCSGDAGGCVQRVGTSMSYVSGRSAAR